MPVVPKYQERERLAPLPDLKTHVSGAPFAASASGARELGEAGRGLSRLGDALFVKAEREREEDERVEFMKLRALREAEVESVVQRESESDDYQTLTDRVMASMADYDKKTADGLQGKRMQKLYGNLVEVGNASLAPKLAGIQQKRRIDGLSADALLAVNTAVQNKRWDEAAAYIENTPDSVWDKEKKAHLISNLDKSRKEYETVVSAQNEAQRLFGKYGVDGIAQALDEIRETHEGQEEELYIGKVNALFLDKKQERDAARERICEAADDLINKKAGYSQVSAFLSQNEAVLGPRLYRRLKEDAEHVYQVGKYAPQAYGGSGGRRGRGGSGGSHGGSGGGKLPAALKTALFFRAKQELADGKFSSPAEFLEAYADAGFSYTDLKTLMYPVFGGSAGGKGGSGKNAGDGFDVMKTINSIVKDFGLDEDPEEEMRFRGAYKAACAEAEKKGKAPLSNEEKIDIAQKMVTKYVVRKELSGVKRFLNDTLGFDLKPEVTTAYGYQIRDAEMTGKISVSDEGVPYTIDEEGNIRGWTPDRTPKLKEPGNRKIKAPDFYPEEPVDKAQDRKDMFPYADVKTEKPSGRKEEEKNPGIRFSPRQ